MSTFRIIEGDCIEVMRDLDESSIDAIVTDPPYGLEFMGKEWDSIGNVSMRETDRNGAAAGMPLVVQRGDTRQPGDDNYQQVDNPYGRSKVRYGYDTPISVMQEWHHAWAVEALRVLKPGGHLLAFGGTRTYHRLACAVEDAGFEIRDTIAWMYGSGFPKSLDVSKAIDKAAGAEREVIGSYDVTRDMTRNGRTGDEAISPVPVVGTSVAITAPATPDAERWQGWGTALKPAFEPVVVARKPLGEKTVAKNVLKHGTGGLNIDGTRIGTEDDTGRTKRRDSPRDQFSSRYQREQGYRPNWARDSDEIIQTAANPGGRWPANVALDEEAAHLLDAQTGELGRSIGGRIHSGATGRSGIYGTDERIEVGDPGYGDTGGASRFFYTAKASREERNRGLGRNSHPTVKPVDLMRWLCRMTTPEGGTVLDPFAGSGSTGIAALREGFAFIGIEREPEYVEIARARIIGDGPLFNAEMTKLTTPDQETP